MFDDQCRGVRVWGVGVRGVWGLGGGCGVWVGGVGFGWGVWGLGGGGGGVRRWYGKSWKGWIITYNDAMRKLVWIEACQGTPLWFRARLGWIVNL